MSKWWQIYYHSVMGALGGLAGWWLIGLIATQQWGVWLAAAFVGAGLGLFIGGMVAATDGAVVKQSRLRSLRDGLRGGLAGAVLGALGMLLAQASFLLLAGGFVGRAVAWLVLGLLIGASDLIVHRQPQRASYAALGGALGGLLGGLFYEALTLAFLAQSGSAQVLLSGVGLVLVGACIGGFIPLARQILAQGELRVLAGEQAGLVREVTDRTTIGYYDGNDLYLPDAGVAWNHAVVRRTAHGFELATDPASDSPAHVGDTLVAPGTALPLKHGDQIRIGEALLQFTGR